MRAYPSYLLLRGLGSFAGACAFTLNLVYQVETVGLGPLQLVTVGTALEVVCFLAQVPTGVIADLRSRRLAVVVGFALLGTGALVEGLVPTFAGVLLGTAVWGVGSTCVDGAEQAWAAGELGDDRVGPAFARGAQLSQLGAVLGIGAAVLAATVSLALPLLVGGGCWLLLAAVLAVGMPEHQFVRPPQRPAGVAVREQLGGAVRAIRGAPVLLALVGAVFFLGLGSEGWDRLSPAHFLDDLAFPALGPPVLWFGAMSAAALLGAVLLTEAVRRRVDATRPRQVGLLLAGFELGRVLATVVFALAGGFWWAAGAWLVSGLLRSAAAPLLDTWLVAVTEPASRATVLSVTAQVDAAGQVLGGPPVGVLGERASVRAALLGTGLLAVPAVLLLARAAIRSRAVVRAAG